MGLKNRNNTNSEERRRGGEEKDGMLLGGGIASGTAMSWLLDGEDLGE